VPPRPKRPPGPEKEEEEEEHASEPEQKPDVERQSDSGPPELPLQVEITGAKPLELEPAHASETGTVSQASSEFGTADEEREHSGKTYEQPAVRFTRPRKEPVQQSSGKVPQDTADKAGQQTNDVAEQHGGGEVGQQAGDGGEEPSVDISQSGGQGVARQAAENESERLVSPEHGDRVPVQLDGQVEEEDVAEKDFE
jgi:hypothetical protein